jgi:hypothetical protein
LKTRVTSMVGFGGAWFLLKAGMTNSTWFAFCQRSVNAVKINLCWREGHRLLYTTRTSNRDPRGRAKTRTDDGGKESDTYMSSGNSYLSFDGHSTYIEIPDSENFSIGTTGELTVSAWIQPETSEPGSLVFPSTEGGDEAYVHWLGKVNLIKRNGPFGSTARTMALDALIALVSTSSTLRAESALAVTTRTRQTLCNLEFGSMLWELRIPRRRISISTVKR